MRSTTARAAESSWSITVWAAHVSIFTAIGLALIFGPERWVSSRSLDTIHDYSHLPWNAIGAIWLACAALLLHRRTRTIGYVIGASLAIVFVGTVLTYTVLPGETTNIVVSLLALLSPLMTYAGARYARRAYPPRRGRTR